MKKIDIVVKALLPFFKDKRNRSTNKYGDCLYNSPNGNHCIVGHFLKPKYKKQGVDLSFNGSAYEDIPYEVTYNYFNKLGLNLIGDLQDFHDNNEYWVTRKITWSKLKELCERNKLDFKYIKSQLIEKCKKN